MSPRTDATVNQVISDNHHYVADHIGRFYYLVSSYRTGINIGLVSLLHVLWHVNDMKLTSNQEHKKTHFVMTIFCFFHLFSETYFFRLQEAIPLNSKITFNCLSYLLEQ